MEEDDDEGPGGPVRNTAPAVRPPEAKDAVKKRDTDGRTAEQATGRRDEVPRRVIKEEEYDEDELVPVELRGRRCTPWALPGGFCLHKR